MFENTTTQSCHGGKPGQIWVHLNENKEKVMLITTVKSQLLYSITSNG